MTPVSSLSNAKLTLDDISDLRAYERERDEFRARIIALKKVRRIGVGPLLTLVFENRDTIRFQIQEMARAERMLSDEQIQTELDTYNPLIPEPGRLAATLFIELTSKAELMEWLPRLVGIEQAIELRIGEGEDAIVVPCLVDERHQTQLTREEITAAVHYVHFALSAAEIDAFRRAPVTVAAAHPAYTHAAPLAESSKKSLLADLSGCP